MVTVSVSNPGVNEDSILHVVKSVVNDNNYERIMEGDSHTEEIAPTSPISPSEVKECEYGLTVIDSIVKHILGQELLQTGSTFKIDSFEEVHYMLSSHPNLLSIIFQSPLVQDVLKDLDLVRTLIATNPLIVRFNELNPGFNNLLYNDNYLLEVIALLSDPNSYINYPQTKQLIVDRVESHLGFPVRFSREYVRLSPFLSCRTAE